MKDCEEIKQAYREHREPREINRMRYACDQLAKLGIETKRVNDQTIEIYFGGHTIIGFPYKGWYTGKGIKDCRGIGSLTKQIKKRLDK